MSRRRLACDAVARALRPRISASQWRRSACVQRRRGSSSRRIRATWGRVTGETGDRGSAVTTGAAAGTFSPHLRLAEVSGPGRRGAPILLEGEEEGIGEQAQGHVVVPAGPGAHLILVQPDLPLGG